MWMFWRIMNMLTPLYYLVIISMAVSVISLTVTKTKVFKPLRLKIDPAIGKENSKKSFWGELFTCPFCFSFYPAFAASILYFGQIRLTFGPVLLGIFPIFDFLICWFCIVCIASFITGFIYRSISQIE